MAESEHYTSDLDEGDGNWAGRYRPEPSLAPADDDADPFPDEPPPPGAAPCPDCGLVADHAILCPTAVEAEARRHAAPAARAAVAAAGLPGAATHLREEAAEFDRLEREHPGSAYAWRDRAQRLRLVAARLDELTDGGAMPLPPGETALEWLRRPKGFGTQSPKGVTKKHRSDPAQKSLFAGQE